MAVSTYVSPEEYLLMAFDGLDREYKDGVIIEKSMPDSVHSRLQLEFGYRVRLLEATHRLFAYPELGLRLAKSIAFPT